MASCSSLHAMRPQLFLWLSISLLGGGAGGQQVKPPYVQPLGAPTPASAGGASIPPHQRILLSAASASAPAGGGRAKAEVIGSPLGWGGYFAALLDLSRPASATSACASLALVRPSCAPPRLPLPSLALPRSCPLMAAPACSRLGAMRRRCPCSVLPSRLAPTPTDWCTGTLIHRRVVLTAG